MSSPETSPRASSPKQTSSTDSAAAGASSKGILRASSIGSLRPSSSGSNTSKSPRDRRASRRSISASSPREASDKLTFADQHGSKLDENHFVEHLHYSDASVDVPQIQQRSCCVIT